MNGILLTTAMGVCGAAAGFLLPAAAERISVYKYRRKGRNLDSDARFTSPRIIIAVSALSAALWALSGLHAEGLPRALWLSVLFSLAIVISIVDLRIRTIPNELVLAMVAAGILFQITYYGFVFLTYSVFTMIGMMLFFTLVAGLVGLGKVGAGDVKLAGVMGLALGYPLILTALAAMCAGLLLYCLTGLAVKKLSTKTMLPFAPFMMFGMTAALVRMLYAG